MKQKISILFLVTAFLLSLGFNVQAQNKNEQLVLAVKSNNYKKVKKLIQRKADVNTKDDYNFTPLMYACIYDTTGNIVQLLLDNGADINAKNSDGLTPLMLACRFDKTVEIIKLLLDNGADVNAKNNIGVTPLIFALKFDKTGNIVKLLLDNGADVNARTDAGLTPLMAACSLDKTGNIVKLLLDNGADINAKSDEGLTPLMVACSYDKTGNIVKLLLDNRADVNARSNVGLTPLMFACKFDKTGNLVKTLLDNGAEVNIKDDDGWTPLMYACLYDTSGNIVKLLIDNKADVNAKDNEGKTVLDYASKNPNPDIINLVLPYFDEKTQKDFLAKQKEKPKEEPIIIAEQMPEFPGGELALRKYIAEHIKYPDLAMEKGIEGTVFVRFVIEKDGSIGEIQITRGVDPLLDQEAVRVVKSLPKFKPGYQDGRPVPVWYSIPIVFKLDNQKLIYSNLKQNIFRNIWFKSFSIKKNLDIFEKI